MYVAMVKGVNEKAMVRNEQPAAVTAAANDDTSTKLFRQFSARTSQWQVCLLYSDGCVDVLSRVNWKSCNRR